MYYDSDDVMPAVNAAVQVFGSQGVYLHGDNVLMNVSVATKEFGKLWYGDVEVSDLSEKCQRLSKLLQKDIFAFMSNENFNFETVFNFPYSK